MTPKKSTLKPRQEKFAKALASGLPLAKAAKKAGYKENRKSAQITSKNLDIIGRVTELREKNEELLETSRQGFIRTIHARFSDEENRDAPKYGEMLAKACGYNAPEQIDILHHMVVNIRIGGKVIE